MERRKSSLETHVHKFLSFRLFFVNFNLFIGSFFTTTAQRTEKHVEFLPTFIDI